MQAFADRLRAGKIIVGDGATGTLLFERVLRPGQAPESATLSHPDVVAGIARQYREAGAEILETNTFGGSPIKLAQARLEHDVERVNRDAVRLAREAAGGRAWVAASCGPCGRLLEPYGDVPADAAYESFRIQMEILASTGVDCIFIETMTDLDEAKLAVRAAKDTAPDIPVAALMTFDRTPRGFFTIMGVSIAAAAAGLEDAGADAVGSNCGHGAEPMVEIAREFRIHSRLPLVIQPNAGLPVTRGERTIYNESPAFMADRMRELVDVGVAVLGGCCGTTPEHIRAIRAMVDELQA